MYSIQQHDHPLKVCIVGRFHPPEFYDWITVPQVQDMFRRMAIETEQDMQKVIGKLQEFNVEIHRPNRQTVFHLYGRYLPANLFPRELQAMVDNTYYSRHGLEPMFNFEKFYQNIKYPSWPDCNSLEEFENLPEDIKKTCREVYLMDRQLEKSQTFQNMAQSYYNCFAEIYKAIESTGSKIKIDFSDNFNGNRVTLDGNKLYFNTSEAANIIDEDEFKEKLILEFPNREVHIVNSKFWKIGDLIIDHNPDPTVTQALFPDCEIVTTPVAVLNTSMNRTRQWVPGFEHHSEIVADVEKWIVKSEQPFESLTQDFGMTIIDPENVIVYGYDENVMRVLDQRGITAHRFNLRHRDFWDTYAHNIISDIHRG